ncbi:hypothetical protein J1605_016088 [Eschrichtius robustus]|uniref:WD repeat-containing protein 86 n=1 Tax=Eschrichtius robustus TaxID=9764 RepID=A0AB34G836_ESCRO|nr:hypothetical protein J1605_016088 [Eschrichtius robustus]
MQPPVPVSEPSARVDEVPTAASCRLLAGLRPTLNLPGAEAGPKKSAKPWGASAFPLHCGMCIQGQARQPQRVPEARWGQSRSAQASYGKGGPEQSDWPKAKFDLCCGCGVERCTGPESYSPGFKLGSNMGKLSQLWELEWKVAKMERGLEGLPGCPLRSAVPVSGADPPSPHPQLVNRHVYSGSADGTVKCWLADTGERVRTFTAHRHSVSALKYHAGTCERWVPERVPVTLPALPIHDPRPAESRGDEGSRAGSKCHCVFTVFTGSGDARARAFDAQSGALRRVFRGHAFIINCIQVHGQVLYTASHDGALRLWDVRGLPRAPPPRPAAPKRSLSRLFSNKVGCAAAAPLQPA